MVKKHAQVWKICFVVLLLFSLNACAHNQISASGENSAASKGSPKAEPQPSYLDFIDILVPSELKVNRDASFIFRTSDLTAGVLAFRGRVDAESLAAFFENNMPNDNWSLISTFKSPKTLMLFKKDTRWCVINIFDGDFYTHAEIWVSPNNHELSSGLLK